MPQEPAVREPKVVVVVLNWNLPDETIECLRSAEPLVAGGTSVVLIDNGSTSDQWPGLEGGLRSLFAELRIVAEADAPTAVVERGQVAAVRLSENLGYAGGNNVGLRIALNSQADWIFLLNNDCQVPEDLVEGVIGCAARMRRPGAIGCQLLTFDDPPRILYGGGSRLYRAGVHWLTKWRKPGGFWPVNFVPFACVALSRDALNAVGLLDERYFAYVEDCDYCYRLGAAGWTMAVNLDVRVRHKVSASLGRRSGRYYYYVARNTPMFILDRLRRPWQLVSFTCFAAQCVALAGRLAFSGRFGEAAALVRGWKDYFLRRTGAMEAAA
jgi:GT2 family glycosyltransferase